MHWHWVQNAFCSVQVMSKSGDENIGLGFHNSSVCPARAWALGIMDQEKVSVCCCLCSVPLNSFDIHKVPSSSPIYMWSLPHCALCSLPHCALLRPSGIKIGPGAQPIQPRLKKCNNLTNYIIYISIHRLIYRPRRPAKCPARTSALDAQRDIRHTYTQQRLWRHPLSG